ncbi:hypothetical protein SBOR_4730 [Sclerotinia borealis F-4128]|uniref:Uncharacterized protein n=1 Tax=Sclerotinia borealis (strain F-4128) TaxID=1432307 RepID=W9CJN2_SCLBF|nr:hypothetical protein SBOR_4730 [Sclerotinia borealis F-4128]
MTQLQNLPTNKGRTKGQHFMTDYRNSKQIIMNIAEKIPKNTNSKEYSVLKAPDFVVSLAALDVVEDDSVIVVAVDEEVPVEVVMLNPLEVEDTEAVIWVVVIALEVVFSTASPHCYWRRTRNSSGEYEVKESELSEGKPDQSKDIVE